MLHQLNKLLEVILWKKQPQKTLILSPEKAYAPLSVLERHSRESNYNINYFQLKNKT